MTTVVQLEHVTKSLGDHTVIHDVSLEIARGELLAMLGPSGCGKTTTLRLIAGLEVPDAGEIRIEGRAVARAGQLLVPPYERGVGLVFQDLALWPHLTVAGNLDFVLTAAKVPRVERRQRIADALALVRIGSLGDRYPHQLSGGEQQRTALARALVGRPRVLLLDEPLSSVDSELRVTLREELRALQRRLALTAVYVTHDREEALSLADRIVGLRNGRLTEPPAPVGG
jgi:ABC-type Fe3+/spermidine/putrescine transport system ATPase subunit